MFRHPKTLRHSFEVATSELLLAFKVVHDQLHMDQAARLSGIAPGAIQTAIQRAARAGLVLLPSQDFLCNTH